jgi:hypothetical protein
MATATCSCIPVAEYAYAHRAPPERRNTSLWKKAGAYGSSAKIPFPIHPSFTGKP